MAHGYLGDGFGTHGEIDPDRDDDHDRRQRDREHSQDWRDQNRGEWRGQDREWRGHDRERDQDWRDREHDRNSGAQRGQNWGERGFFFSERPSFREERIWSEREQRWPADRWPEQGGRASGYNRQAEDWSGQHRQASANPDDHYLSWRDRHMAELDRDYADYCRECEQQFHKDFDDWRSKRQQGSSGQQSPELIEAEENERARDRAMAGEGSIPSAEGAATLGTNNPQNAHKGRGGR